MRPLFHPCGDRLAGGHLPALPCRARTDLLIGWLRVICLLFPTELALIFWFCQAGCWGANRQCSPAKLAYGLVLAGD